MAHSETPRDLSASILAGSETPTDLSASILAGSETLTDLSASILAGSEVHFDFFCQPCSPDKHVEAESYCKECAEYHCITCMDCHGKLWATKHHKVLGKSAMKIIKPTLKIQRTDEITEKCHKHPDKVLDYFCKSHDQICCSACVTLEHGSCSENKYIPEVSSGIAISKEYITLRADLDIILRQITRLQDKNNYASKNYKKKHSTTLANIRELRRQVIDILDKLEEDVKRKVTEIHQNNTDVIRKVSEKCNSLLSEVKSMTIDMDKTAKGGKHNQLFVQVKLSAHRIAEVEKYMKNEKADCKVMITRQDFDKDEKLQGLMSKLSDMWSLFVRQHVTPTKARYIQEVSVKTEDDTTFCDIRGIAVVNKNRVVIADKGNNAVKLYDMKLNMIVSRLSVPTEPLDITKMHANQVAVALEAAQIVIINVSDTLLMSTIIETPGADIYRLCYYGPNFITACWNPYCVKIIDMSGKTLKIFSTDDNGEQLFDSPRYIALSRDRDLIYITDKSHAVVCLTPSGRVISVYRHDKLRKPLGVAVGKDSALYVCSRNNQTVHQLTSTGDLVQIILEPDQNLSRYPFSIAYEEENDMLYIGSDCSNPEEENYIRLFQLE